MYYLQANVFSIKKGDRDHAVLSQCFRALLPLLLTEDQASLRCVQALGCIALVDKALVDQTKLKGAPRTMHKKEWAELESVL
jgi:hypothetical protein